MSRLAIAALVLILPTAAHADDDVPFAFVAPNLGLNAPLGALGLEVGAGYEWFRGSVGAGVGFGGLEVAATVRALTQLSAVDLGVGLGFSRGGAIRDLDIGGPGELPDREPDVRYDANTLWTNLEVVAELQMPAGAFMRFYGGITSPTFVECVVALDDGGTEPCSAAQRMEIESDRYQPYVGFATGIRWPQPPPSRPTFIVPASAPPFPRW